MQNKTFVECIRENFLEHWGNVASNKKPIIAAVNGFAVGTFVFLVFIFTGQLVER